MVMSRPIMIITAIIIPVFTIFIGSDVLIAELLTDFHVGTTGALPGWLNIKVSNIGLVQANNVIFTIFTNVTIDKFKNVCPEGDMYRSNNQTIIVKFQKMSPHMFCLFSMNAAEPGNIGFMITSDNRSVWALNTPFHYTPTVSWHLFIPLILEFLIIIMLWSRIIINFSQRQKFTIDFKESKRFDRKNVVRQFVYMEYGVKINTTDVAILELIHKKKKTITQLINYSELHWMHVHYRVWKMRQLDLVSKELLILDVTLADFFKSEFG